MPEPEPTTPTLEGSMPAETTALDVLTKQVEHLTAQISTLTTERDESRNELKATRNERDKLKATPQAETRIAELEAAIRDRQHYDKFADRAVAAGAKTAAIRHLWQVSGYKAETDTIDEKILDDLVADLREQADYAFDVPGDAPETPPVEPERQTSRTKYGLELRATPPPGAAGRAKRNQGGDGTIVTAEMRADPRFMLDPANQELILDAAKSGRFR